MIINSREKKNNKSKKIAIKLGQFALIQLGPHEYWLIRAFHIYSRHRWRVAHYVFSVESTEQ